MSRQQVFIDSPDTTYTDERYPLGTRRFCSKSEANKYLDADIPGDIELLFVYNDEASASFSAGDVIVVDTDYAYCNGVRSSAMVDKARVLGVAVTTIEAGSYGWIATGKSQVNASVTGAATPGGALVTSSTAGALAPASSPPSASEVAAIVGYAVEPHSGSASNVLVQLDL